MLTFDLSEIASRTFSFLASGPSFVVNVPASYDAIPELSSPLGNGVGIRSFDFSPTLRDPGVDLQENTLVRTVMSADGRSADLYHRIEDPPLWWLRWQTPSGGLYTHLREEDGPDMPDATVKNVEIVDSGLPFLVVNPPFKFRSSTAPNYQERALFFGTGLGPQFGVMFQRPSTVPAGTAVVSPTSEVAGVYSARAGTSLGIEIRAWASTAAGCSAVLASALGSLVDLR